MTVEHLRGLLEQMPGDSEIMFNDFANDRLMGVAAESWQRPLLGCQVITIDVVEVKQ